MNKNHNNNIRRVAIYLFFAFTQQDMRYQENAETLLSKDEKDGEKGIKIRRK